MAEATQYTFSHKEIVEALIKKQGLHEGLWSLYVEFGLHAANLSGPIGNEAVPVAIIPILKMGLQQGKIEDSLTADAAKVNPKPQSKG